MQGNTKMHQHRTTQAQPSAKSLGTISVTASQRPGTVKIVFNLWAIDPKPNAFYAVGW